MRKPIPYRYEFVSLLFRYKRCLDFRVVMIVRSRIRQLYPILYVIIPHLLPWFALVFRLNVAICNVVLLLKL